MGGNFTVSGFGGVKRKSHQMTGSRASAARASGVMKLKAERKFIA